MAKLSLDGSVEVVEIHFSFSNGNMVPASVTRWEEENPETTQELHERKHEYIKGEMIIPPTEKCDGRTLLSELEAAGFQMYDARHQLRIHPKQANVRYHTVRFLFGRKLTGSNKIFAIHRVDIRKDLQKLFDDAMWRLRAYRNPFFENGTVVTGKAATSLNFEARKPFGERERLPGSAESTPVKPAHEVRVWNEFLGVFDLVA